MKKSGINPDFFLFSLLERGSKVKTIGESFGACPAAGHCAGNRDIRIIKSAE